jgi:hypothetical protein
MSRPHFKAESGPLALLLHCLSAKFAYNKCRLKAMDEEIHGNESDSERARLPKYDIPAQSPLPASNGSVLIVTCTTCPEADRVVKILKKAGISANIENKWAALTNRFADLRNNYPHIRIRISSKNYDAAKELLMGTARADQTS